MSVNIYSKDEKLINVCRGSGSGLPEPEAKDKLLLSTENAETSKIEWSQVDKYKAVEIPVYETKAAAEADIANLSDGQLIATKDEGNEFAKPVDVVESGNLHAVTSNAVAERLKWTLLAVLNISESVQIPTCNEILLAHQDRSDNVYSCNFVYGNTGFFATGGFSEDGEVPYVTVDSENVLTFSRGSQNPMKVYIR